MNTTEIIIPDDYISPFPPLLKPDKTDPSLFLSKFSQAWTIIEYWKQQHSPHNPEDKIDQCITVWVKTSCKTIFSYNNSTPNDNWIIPAFFMWCRDNLHNSKKLFLGYIASKYCIPYAIGIKAYNSWGIKIWGWKSTAIYIFLKNKAPFPRCSALQTFLYEASLWDPTEEDATLTSLTINFLLDMMKKSPLDPTKDPWFPNTIQTNSFSHSPTSSSSSGREPPPLTNPITARTIDCSVSNLKIYCHNIQGLGSEEK